MEIKIREVAQNAEHAARLQFIAWLQAEHPELYVAAMKQATAPGLGAAEGQQTIWEKLSGALVGIAGAKAQYDLVQLNIDRAKQGMPPIDPASIAPVVRTQLTMTPEMAASFREGTGTALKYAMFAAAAIAGYFLLVK